MNTRSLANAFKHGARVVARFVRKNKRVLAGIANVALTTGGVVLACRNTLKIQPVIDQIHEDRKDMSIKKHIRQSVAKEAMVYAKAYAGPAAMIIGGEAVHQAADLAFEAENAALVTAIGTLTAQVAKLKKPQLDILENDQENGDTDETPEDTPYRSKLAFLSPYAVRFDQNHSWWEMPATMRYTQFSVSLDYLNNKLKSHGPMSSSKYPKPLYMNDIYEEFHFPDTALGTHSGYWYDLDNHDADNRIDLTFYDDLGNRITEFPNGIDIPCWVDFNVDYGDVTKFVEVN